MLPRFIILNAIALLALAARAADWPQFRGPARDGSSTEQGWLAQWPADAPPKIAWRAKVGKGHAAPSVVGDRLYIAGWDGASETVLCLDVASGKPVWRQSYPSKTIQQWPGPRASPAIADGVVYTLGQHGQLVAWAVNDGAQRWSITLSDKLEPDDDYGFAWSPLVVGDLLILGGGTRGLAVRRADGKVAWGGDEARGACASAVPFALAGGRTGVALITQQPDRESANLVGVDAATGKELWRHGPWNEKWGAACADPLVANGKVFVTTAEQYKRSARFSIDGNTLKQDWSSATFAAYTGGCVLLGGHLFGVSHAGKLTCLDWETGKTRWSERGFNEHGALIAADGMLIVQTGKAGDVVVARATGDRYEELRRATVFDDAPATFTASVFANGRLYCRSYAGELVCIDLRAR